MNVGNQNIVRLKEIKEQENYYKNKMINKLKVGYFVISSGCLEITVQCFEEVKKKPAGFF